MKKPLQPAPRARASRPAPASREPSAAPAPAWWLESWLRQWLTRPLRARKDERDPGFPVRGSLNRAPLWLAALCAARLAAQAVPQTINYQGRLTDHGSPSPAPVNGVVTIRFDLFDAATGGASLWNESDTVAVNGGVFSVMLGTVNPLPPSLFTGGVERHLELTLNPGPAQEVLAPRQKLGTQGFAAHAATSADSFGLGGLAPGSWQRAVAGACPAGQFLSALSPDGTPQCGAATVQAPLALTSNATSPSATFLGYNTADGYGVFGASANGVGVMASTSAGMAIQGVVIGDGFQAGNFETWGPMNAHPTVRAVSGGLGPAGDFRVNNPGSPAPALTVATAGDGAAVLAQSASGIDLNAAGTGVIRSVADSEWVVSPHLMRALQANVTPQPGLPLVAVTSATGGFAQLNVPVSWPATQFGSALLAKSFTVCYRVYGSSQIVFTALRAADPLMNVSDLGGENAIRNSPNPACYSVPAGGAVTGPAVIVIDAIMGAGGGNQIVFGKFSVTVSES